MRAARSSPTLTLGDAVEVWGMRWRGMCQHEVAAVLHVNPGRINEVLRGRRFPEAECLAREARGLCRSYPDVCLQALPGSQEQTAAAVGVAAEKDGSRDGSGEAEPQQGGNAFPVAD